MPFTIIRNDITKVHADAIVNTANPKPIIGGGTDSAIYRAAGPVKLLEERKKIGYIPIGEVAVTKAFALPARYIIHTVGPVWIDGNHGEFDDLASCYRKSLLIAEQLGCKTIAFPLISTGTYGFPKEKALSIALDEIRHFLEDSDNEMQIILVVFDKKSFDISSGLISDINQFIDDHYVGRAEALEYRYGRQEHRPGRFSAEMNEEEDTLQLHPMNAPSAGYFSTTEHLEDVMKKLEESFSTHLLKLIDERGYTDVEVYKKANLDRKLFSKIRCNKNYIPKKKTALALAIALELNLDETTDLLGRAGIALSPSSKSDLIVEYCIAHKIFSIYDINALLFEYDQPCLGGQ